MEFVPGRAPPYAPALRMRIDHPVSRLPNELLTEIFECLCETEPDDNLEDYSVVSYRLYTDRRDAVCEAYDPWRALVEGQPRFWRQLFIDCTTTPEFVARHVSFVGSLLLEVRIVLDATIKDFGVHRDDEDSTSVPYTDLDSISDIVRDCLLAARPSTHLWRDLQFLASNDSFLLHWLNVFGNAPAPVLRTFLFACPSSVGNHRSCCGLFVTPPHLFRHLPALRMLRLIAATLPWGEASYFSRLEDLEIRDLPVVAWPTVPALIRTLVCSSAIRRLVLGGGGVVLDEHLVVDCFVMANLQTLTIFFAPHTARFLSVLAAGRFPSLTEFNAHSFTDAGWLLTFETTIYTRLQRMTMSGQIDRIGHIPLLLDHLDGISHLDVSDTEPAYVCELVRTAATRCTSMRSLDVVILHGGCTTCPFVIALRFPLTPK
ncbi:hypothetical protein C8R47DRAFT_1206637 [Mycena vitilis]|nr:hypothetical protein C8R47DRAFT_1206637 [Mycena vitilis]